LKHAAGGAEKRKIPRFGMTCNLVKPANRIGLQTGLGWPIGRIYEFNFNFNGVLPALYPSLSFFASFVHGVL
jgi:hypothetical protein